MNSVFLQVSLLLKNMADTIKIDIIKTETIKPFSPTLPHLKTFKLCPLDQFQSVIYGPVVFFYPKNDGVTSEQRSKQLKKSLSEALTLFYRLPEESMKTSPSNAMTEELSLSMLDSVVFSQGF